MYKIQRKSDGLFSTGGVHPRWNTIGKTWNLARHVVSHLRQLSNWRNQQYSNDCVIVEFELVVKNEIDIQEFRDSANKRKQERLMKERKQELQSKIRELEVLQDRLANELKTLS